MSKLKTFIIRQTLSLDLQRLLQAESEEQAIDFAYGSFDPTKVEDCQPLDWDHPWDAEEVEGTVPKTMSETEFAKWREVGVL